MSREMLAAAVLVWLIGAIVGWCAGWAARTEQNRGWHADIHRQLQAARAELAQLHDELAEALDELKDARADQWRAAAPAQVPTTVVAVHLAAPAPPWGTCHPAVIAADPAPVPVDVMPVLPAQGAQS